LHKVIDAVLDQQPSLRQMVRVLDLSSQHVDLLRAAGVDRIGKLNASLESYSVKRGQSLRFRRSAQKFLTATGQTQRANELSEAIRRQVASVQAIKEAS
jgi:hypothetical protein